MIASVHGLVASPAKAAYVSAKHGVIGLVKALALEGAPHGITATAVCPAVARTPLIEGQLAGLAKAHGISEEQALNDILLASQAVKRMIEPAEVAAAVAFLLSPEGRAFTGTRSPSTRAGQLAERHQGRDRTRSFRLFAGRAQAENQTLGTDD